MPIRDDSEPIDDVVVPLVREQTFIAPMVPRSLPPLGAVVEPLRVRHRSALRRLAAWSISAGGSIDLDVAAVCLDELEELRTGDGRLILDRPSLNSFQWSNVHNRATMLGTLLPEHWHTDLWSVLGWLDATDGLDPSSDPLHVLREPLRCYGMLGEDGRPMPDGVDVDFACQCYVPYDPTLPPGLGFAIVGHDWESYEPHLARARLRPRSQATTSVDLEPLFILARRLRRERSFVLVHVEDFSFQGVVVPERSTPELWLYHHDPTSRRGHPPLAVDAEGRTWVTRADGRRRAGFRWEQAHDRSAVLRTGAGRDDDLPDWSDSDQ